MKKTKKAFAALALSATLAMGAVPAFAEDAKVNDTGSFAASGDSGTGTTQLNIQATASQIQATLPIDITIITPAAGGTITAPSANAYKITNNNAKTDLKIQKITGVEDNGWVFKTTLSDSANVTTKGELKLSVKAGSSAPLAIMGDVAVPENAAAYFTVPKGESLGLTLEGETAVKDSLSTDSPIKAAKIQYTVAVPATPAS